jgi:hypothetical protein
MKIMPWSDKIWFSPKFIIDFLAQAGGKANKEQMKRLKEAWICAVSMICRAQVERAEYWLQLPRRDPPDILAMKLVPTPNGTDKDISRLKVEVFELSQHDSEPIAESIKRKLKNQDYAGFVVIGFLMRASPIDYAGLTEAIRKASPKVGALSLLVHERLDGSTVMTYIQLYPKFAKVKFDFGKYCKESRQDDYIVLRRSGTLRTDTDSRNGSPTVVP